jgi:hypothetical protein
LGHLEEGISSGVRTDRKPRANKQPAFVLGNRGFIDRIIKYGNSSLPRVRSAAIGNPEIGKEMGMVGVLLVKPLLLLGGAGYLAYRFLQKTVKSLQDGEEEREFTRSGGIELTPCAKCGMYTRSDAAQCPCCGESKDSPLRSG